MREIVFDTETTGFDFPSGDRLVEIGCVELVNRVMTRELDTFTSFMFEVYDASEDMPYGARARYSVQALFDYARRHPAGLRVLIGHREGGSDRRLYAALEPRIAARLRQNYAERGARIAASADTLASLLLGMSLDVAHRALIVEQVDPVERPAQVPVGGVHDPHGRNLTVGCRQIVGRALAYAVDPGTESDRPASAPTAYGSTTCGGTV